MSFLEMLPEFYANSEETAAFQASLEPELELLQADAQSVLDQLFVNTATWGLTLWERAYGIATDISRPDEWRRTRIISKLRGQGTTTKAMIINVAESFSNGTVDIIEFPAESRFDVKFTGTIGVPPNMDDLTAALEEIKPAHLVYGYIYIYRTHATLKKYTHAQLAKFDHKTLKGGEMN